jgi:multicomponent Na+:H+ antiporter subunit F
MSAVFQLAALFLLLNLIAGLMRIWRGPRAADRMQALLLFGTTTVGMLLLLAYAGLPEAVIKVALVFVMLAAIGTIAFVGLPASMDRSVHDERQRLARRPERDEP